MELVANADVSKETETHSRQNDATRGILIAKAGSCTRRLRDCADRGLNAMRRVSNPLSRSASKLRLELL